nr:major histocompatibility complex class I-related gene protein-like [Nothobranchius furzeri]
MKKIFNDHKLEFGLLAQYCLVDMPAFFKHLLVEIKQHLNQSEAAHIIQRVAGCEWDQNTKTSSGFLKYGYDGGDFLRFNLETKSWTSLTPKADFIKRSWDADTKDLDFHVYMLSAVCPLWLNRTLSFGNTTVLETRTPTVSLLQRTPSSPVRCHASGFYPPSVQLIWRKDGEQIREIHGEILPNDDETFQLHVDLDISSLRYEDWPRYDCSFQFSGAEEKIVLRLDKTAIHTNWKNTSLMIVAIAVILALILLIIAALGFIFYKKKTEPRPLPGYENIPL